MTPVRRVLSALVAVAGALVVVLCGRSLVITPQLMAQHPPAAPGLGGEAATALVVFPLLVSTGVLTGLLLIWAGVRGLRTAADPLLWRDRQRAALWGCLIGGVLGLFIFCFGDSLWTGMPPDSRLVSITAVVFYSLTGFLLVMVLVLQEEHPPARVAARGGDRRRG